MKLPLVDVYVLSYKRPKFLRTMLESLIGQDYTAIRITVIDNCSTLETQDVLSDFAGRYTNFSFRTFSDSGLDRINIPFLWSDADFVFIPHDDDLVACDWLSRGVHFLLANPNVGAVFSRFYMIDESGTPIYSHTHGYPPGNIEIGSFVGHFLTTSELPIFASGIFRMETITKHNIRFENPRTVGVALDIQLLRDLNAVSTLHCIDYGGYYYRTHNGQTAVTLGFEATCSAVYIVSSENPSDSVLAKKMLGNLANLSLCQPIKMSPQYTFVMRLIRWLCKSDVHLSIKLLSCLVKLCRQNLGKLVLGHR